MNLGEQGLRNRGLGRLERLEQDEFWSDRVPLTPTLSRIARRKTGVLPNALLRERGRNPFSRLREKVAGDSRPDEGLRRDSFKNHHAL